MTTFNRVVKAKRMEPPHFYRDPVLNHIHPRWKREQARQQIVEAKANVETPDDG